MATVYYTATSLDGFLADEQNSLDWLFRLDDGSDPAAVDPHYATFIAGVGAIAMGSTTYRWVLEHHVASGEAWPYEQPCWVFSNRELLAVPGADIRFVHGDVTSVHADMVAAAGGKDVWLVGGGDLVGQFFDAGLLDELTLAVAPVTLGAGAPLLPRRIDDPALQLVSAEASGGFALLRLRVRSGEAGALRAASAGC